jgi:anti-sigma regulatory factor (Ser/Thr protein kinase)
VEAAMALDQAFDANTLQELRKAALAEATAAGMPDDRAADVMIAVHELAANAVRHGAGAGRLRMRAVAGELHCQVSDVGPASVDGHPRRAGPDAAWPWPVRPGCGLWLVQKVADRVSAAAGPGGSRVMVVFALPGFRGGPAGY